MFEQLALPIIPTKRRNSSWSVLGSYRLHPAANAPADVEDRPLTAKGKVAVLPGESTRGSGRNLQGATDQSIAVEVRAISEGALLEEDYLDSWPAPNSRDAVFASMLPKEQVSHHEGPLL